MGAFAGSDIIMLLTVSSICKPVVNVPIHFFISLQLPVKSIKACGEWSFSITF